MRCIGCLAMVLTIGCGRVSYRPADGSDATRTADTGLDALVDAPGDGGPADSGLDGSARPDTGLDGDRDAGLDASFDGGRDSGLDASFDGGRDAGLDASFDGGRDAGRDAGLDASFDGGRDASPDAMTDPCGLGPLEFRFDGDYRETHDRALLVPMGSGNTFTDGRAGNALALDGSGFARIANGPISQIMLGPELTMEAWVFVASPLAEGRIIDRMTPGLVDGSLLDIHTTRTRMYAGLQGTYGAVMPTGRWVHLAAVRSPIGIRLYVDGVVTGMNPDVATPADNGHPITIGADSTGATRLVGRLDELRIHCRALSASEVAAHAGL